MMENGMWPLNGANKKSPQATPADDNDNIRKTPVSTVQETIYVDDEALPYYEYIELTTSENSQYLDPDSSDDDGHTKCRLGGTNIIRITLQSAQPQDIKKTILMKTTRIHMTEG